MSRQSARIRKKIRAWQRWLLILLGAGVLAAFLVLLLGPVTIWATPATTLHGKDKADALNATRQTLLAAVGGTAVLAGAAFTARTYYLSRRGQLTDRYARAIALLASDKITERLGGVYALEHLMIESEREHETVLEVLAAFIREHTKEPAAGNLTWDAEHHHEGGNDEPRLDTDVQAALTVIGRRPQRAERNPVDLSQADLCGADLSDLNLDGVWLWRAKLRSAKLLGTHLKGANLAWAQLQDAGLTDAHMQHAYLSEAQLQKAVLIRTRLQDADLSSAHLQGAYLGGANLQGATLNRADLQGADLIAYPTGEPLAPARGLTASQLSDAVIDDHTRLPEELRNTLPPGNPDPH